MLSIIIPAYNDPFLQKTINSVLKNAVSEIEVLPIIDGYTPKPKIKVDKRVKPIVFSQNRGMRGAINAGLVRAKGKFIMKCDSHCAFGPGFDKIMAENCEKDWLVVPRRYSLDEVHWKIDPERPPRDYHYLTFPGLTPQDWLHRTIRRRDPQYDVDDTMTFQGSCWFAQRSYFAKRVGFLDYSPQTYSAFGGEQVEIGLKYWLGGGTVKVNKKTWYAHLSKRPGHYKAGVFSRYYKINRSARRGRIWLAKHWLGNNEPKMIHPLSWLVEKFWPVPSWPEDRLKWFYP